MRPLNLVGPVEIDEVYVSTEKKGHASTTGSRAQWPVNAGTWFI